MTRLEADARRGVECIHCGLPVPPGLIDPDADEQFCCAGCRAVYETIQGCGLDRYYELRRAQEEDRAAARTTGKGYEDFDDPTFAEMYFRDLPDGLQSVQLQLEGMHCAACVWLIEKLPSVVPGVVEARVDMRRELVHLTWDPAAVKLSKAAGALDTLGYPVHPVRAGERAEIRRREDRKHLIRIGVAGVTAGNVMLMALSLYGSLGTGMDPAIAALLRWTSMVLGLICLAWPGSVFYRGAIAAIRTRTLHMDMPVAVALTAGGIWGTVNTIRGSGEIYFDSLTTVVFLLLVGRYIQHRQQRRASDAIELLYNITSSSARLVERDDNGHETGVRIVPIEAVKADDLVDVLAGESIPADGVIERGTTTLDESMLTGESIPVEAGPERRVSAGAVNLSSPIRVRVLATGESTRVGRLMLLVEQYASRRAPIVRLADRLSGYFVTVVLSLAVLTGVLWLVLDFSHPGRALNHAVALLIVTCPCALGLATPLAVIASIGRAAGRGILVKGGDALELLARPGVILLDKTGTLTQGRTRLVRWIGDESAKSLAAAVEAGTTHPVARAIVEAAMEAGNGEIPEAQAIIQHVGQSIEGLVGSRRVLVGSPSAVRASATAAPWVDEAEAGLLDEALTPVLVAVDGKIVAAAGLGDPLREDAPAAVADLLAKGWDVRICSGDHERVVRAVGRRLGLEPDKCMGGVTPEGKLAEVERISGTVVMAGDGVNDAAALSAATVGIAVHGGAEASLQAADVYLSRPGLALIVELMEGAGRTVRVIRLNLTASLFYNAISAALAMAGVIGPLAAAVLMPISSLTVITLSYRMRTFGAE